MLVHWKVTNGLILANNRLTKSWLWITIFLNDIKMWQNNMLFKGHFDPFVLQASSLLFCSIHATEQLICSSNSSILICICMYGCTLCSCLLSTARFYFFADLFTIVWTSFWFCFRDLTSDYLICNCLMIDFISWHRSNKSSRVKLIGSCTYPEMLCGTNLRKLKTSRLSCSGKFCLYVSAALVSILRQTDISAWLIFGFYWYISIGQNSW